MQFLSSRDCFRLYPRVLDMLYFYWLRENFETIWEMFSDVSINAWMFDEFLFLIFLETFLQFLFLPVIFTFSQFFPVEKERQQLVISG